MIQDGRAQGGQILVAARIVQMKRRQRVGQSGNMIEVGADQILIFYVEQERVLSPFDHRFGRCHTAKHSLISDTFTQKIGGTQGAGLIAMCQLVACQKSGFCGEFQRRRSYGIWFQQPFMAVIP